MQLGTARPRVPPVRAELPQQIVMRRAGSLNRDGKGGALAVDIPQFGHAIAPGTARGLGKTRFNRRTEPERRRRGQPAKIVFKQAIGRDEAPRTIRDRNRLFRIRNQRTEQDAINIRLSLGRCSARPQESPAGENHGDREPGEKHGSEGQNDDSISNGQRYQPQREKCRDSDADDQDPIGYKGRIIALGKAGERVGCHDA